MNARAIDWKAVEEEMERLEAEEPWQGEQITTVEVIELLAAINNRPLVANEREEAHAA